MTGGHSFNTEADKIQQSDSDQKSTPQPDLYLVLDLGKDRLGLQSIPTEKSFLF